MDVNMGNTLEVLLPDQLDEAIEKREEMTGQSKSEITRNALVRELYNSNFSKPSFLEVETE